MEPFEFKMLKVEPRGIQGTPWCTPEGQSRPSYSKKKVQGGKDEHKRTPRDAQDDPRWTKKSSKGVQTEPKGSPREQKGHKCTTIDPC